jgi:nucleotide-binding universal stress UspA family protein
MIKRILFPTDGSAFSARAAEYVISFAKTYRGSVTALHVIYVKPPRTLDAKSVKKEMARQAEICFRPLRKVRGIKLNTKILVSRSIADAILDEAQEGEYDLIVMGSKGITGLKRVLLGSVCEEVVRRAPCPVLVVR